MPLLIPQHKKEVLVTENRMVLFYLLTTCAQFWCGKLNTYQHIGKNVHMCAAGLKI